LQVIYYQLITATVPKKQNAGWLNESNPTAMPHLVWRLLASVRLALSHQKAGTDKERKKKTKKLK
jgi:hypothetical protein